MIHSKDERGFALISALMLAALLTALLASYFFLTRVELLTTKSSMDSTRGFYAAEAGLNIRAELIRQEFLGYNRPTGTTPIADAGSLPCRTTARRPRRRLRVIGAGDFACTSEWFQNREILTYVAEDALNPTPILIPPGEPYQNLNAQEYGYDVHALSVFKEDDLESILNMHLMSRLVPLFQFAAFYNKDLEILPGPDMTFEGPVHANGDIYLGANATLTMEGQLTVAGQLFNGRKNVDSCMPGTVSVFDPGTAQPIPACGPGRVEVVDTDVTAWNGMIRIDVDAVTVPPPEALDPTPGEIYWDKADLRVMLDLNGATPAIEVRNPDGSVDTTQSDYLNNGCGAALLPVDSTSTSFHNFRENTDIEMLEIDVEALMNCAELDSALMGGKTLDDTTEGGLVWYLGVDGPDSDTVNNYGVRVKNGEELAPTVGTTEIQGLTFVTNQALYVEGNYNSDANWKPAAFLADSLNVLSEAWSDANSHNTTLSSRTASGTTIYAAFLAGTDSTGNTEGNGGQDSGDYNGGLENYPRFHETWSGQTLLYRGSFVSLNLPVHVNGAWGDQSYSPPVRDWGYELRFNDAANLPPLSPRFVYLRQDQFLRTFDL